MAYLECLYCTLCHTTILGKDYPNADPCKCTTSMEHVLGMPEAERREQDYSTGPMLPILEVLGWHTIDLAAVTVSAAVAEQCMLEMEYAKTRGWRP